MRESRTEEMTMETTRKLTVRARADIRWVMSRGGNADSLLKTQIKGLDDLAAAIEKNCAKP